MSDTVSELRIRAWKMIFLPLNVVKAVVNFQRMYGKMRNPNVILGYISVKIHVNLLAQKQAKMAYLGMGIRCAALNFQRPKNCAQIGYLFCSCPLRGLSNYLAKSPLKAKVYTATILFLYCISFR